MSDSGAQITQNQDPRFTKFLGLGMAVLLAAVVGIGGWIGSSLVGIKESLAGINAQNVMFAASLQRNDLRDDAQDSRINKNERDIAVVEGRALRGIQNFGRDTRGN